MRKRDFTSLERLWWSVEFGAVTAGKTQCGFTTSKPASLFVQTRYSTGVGATIPDVPNVVAIGDDRDEALRRFRDALRTIWPTTGEPAIRSMNPGTNVTSKPSPRS